MKTWIMIWAVVASLNAVASEWSDIEPVWEWCNEVQTRIMKRVEDIRKYDKEKFVSACKWWIMRFMLPSSNAWFIITPDWLTYVCTADGKDVVCVEPKEEDEAIELLNRIYWKRKINI